MSEFTLRYNSMYCKDIASIQHYVSDRVNSVKRKTRPKSNEVHKVNLVSALGNNNISLFLAEYNLYTIGFSCDSKNYFFSDFYNTSLTKKFNGGRLPISSEHSSLETFKPSNARKPVMFHTFWESIDTLSSIKLKSSAPIILVPEKRALSSLIISLSEALRFNEINQKINEMSRGHLSKPEKEKVLSRNVDRGEDMIASKLQYNPDATSTYGFKTTDYEDLIHSWENQSQTDSALLDISLA